MKEGTMSTLFIQFMNQIHHKWIKGLKSQIALKKVSTILESIHRPNPLYTNGKRELLIKFSLPENLKFTCLGKLSSHLRNFVNIMSL